jgi:hypothetical protein
VICAAEDAHAAVPFAHSAGTRRHLACSLHSARATSWTPAPRTSS